MQSGKKASKKLVNVSKPPSSVPQEPECYEGECLARLLKLIQREIESARILDGDALPEKIWFKLQFAIGVNEVTRGLERMAPIANMEITPQQPHVFRSNSKPPSVELQVILLAADCHPRWLTKHLPSLALSRNVPVIYVKDNKGGSLRLGELVKLKTAIVVGIKAKGNAINQLIEKILRDELNLKLSESPLHPVALRVKKHPRRFINQKPFTGALDTARVAAKALRLKQNVLDEKWKDFFSNFKIL